MQDYLVSFDKLTTGIETKLGFDLDKCFFDSFDNEEIIDANILVDVALRKKAKNIELDCAMKGSVVMRCDRCLEDLTLPLNTNFALNIQFVESDFLEKENSTEAKRDENVEIESIFLPLGESTLDLGQIIYDYSCLALPLQRVHGEGGCNVEVLKYLGAEHNRKDEVGEIESKPFFKLKALLGEPE